MNISWIGTIWAAVKGAFAFGTTAKLSIVDYLMESAYATYSKVDKVMENIEKTHASLVKICDKLDYYSAWIPTPWMGYYSNICDALKALRDCIADGKVDRSEIERIVEIIKSAINAWSK